MQSVPDGRAFSQSQQSAKPDQVIRREDYEDRVLIARGLSGDRQALDELFTRYARTGYRNALAILGSPEDAEDALQDGLFSAFRNLQRFQGRADFSTWLTRIVINAALMKVRTRRVYPTVPLTNQTGERGQRLIDVLHDPHPTPEAELSGRQVCGIITDAVCELPQQQKRVLLHYSSGWPARNIAESLGISVGCVKSTLHRARLKVAMRLRARMSPAELAGRVRSPFAVPTGCQEGFGRKTGSVNSADSIGTNRRSAMRKVALSTVVVLVFASLSFAQGHHARTFRGQIMDSMCASMGGHSPAGYKATDTHTPKDCTLACVKGGSTFVLYNAARKATLKLDDQNKARDFAGENVRVIGTYDRATKTIHVDKIEAAS